MARVKTRAIQQVVTGLRGGGQIAMPIIEAAVEDALDWLYDQTAMLKIELEPIDEVEGQDEYTLPSLTGDGRICSIDRLYRVTYDSEGAETGRTVIDDTTYAVGLKTDTTGSLASIEEILSLDTESSLSTLDGLILFVNAAFRVDDYIPSMHLYDSEMAVAAKVIAGLAVETGKPWSDEKRAAVETYNYSQAIARIRHRVIRGNNSRELKASSATGFII